MRNLLIGMFLLIVAAALWSSDFLPSIIPAAVAPSFRQGSTGTKFAIATGSFTSGNCLQTDANGNVVDAGATCGTATSLTGPINAGSTMSQPQWIEYVSGVCQGATPSVSWDLPVSNPATAICKTGTNTQLSVAQFTANGQRVQQAFVLPDDWISVLSVEFRFLSETAASTGNVVWNFQYACVANTGASIDPSLAAAQTVSVAAGANNVTNIATLNTPTISGCSAGQKMFFQLGLDAGTTASGNEDLLSARFKLKRTITAL